MSDGCHPVILKYREMNRDLLEILCEEPEPRSPVIEAAIALRESLTGKTAPETALRKAEEVPGGKYEANLYVFFLSLWAYVSVQNGNLEQARALLRRGESLLAPDVIPEVQTSLLAVEGVLASYSGNTARRSECISRELSLLPADSPKRRIALSDRNLFMAQMGMLAECEDDLKEVAALAAEDPAASRRLDLALLVNAVETGALEKADSILGKVVGHDSPVMQIRAVTMLAQVLMDILRCRPREEWQTPLRDDKAGWEIPVWADSTAALQRGDAEEALHLARRYIEELAGRSPGSGFAAYTLVRAELAAGNAGAGLRLLSSARLRGRRHYFDDLFYARVEMLCGNSRAATRHFAAVLRSVDQYDAKGRLDLELRLALELSPADLVELSRTAQTELTRREDAAAATPEPKSLPQREMRGANRLVGPSSELKRVREMVAKVAAANAAVLITGETGTGKELVAHAIHEESPRSAEPFLAVNCGAIAEGLLESELFGHERGAFTGASRARKGIFEEAGQGTVFLDEIGEVSSRIQVAFLRVLEAGEIRPVGGSRDRKVSCRVVAATNADVDALAAGGSFRKDLLYRLKRLIVEIPPLRERPEDILPLADLFLSEGRHGEGRPVMSDGFKKVLLDHSWPGNVRELRNVIERVRLLNSDKLGYDAADLEGYLSPVRPRPAESSPRRKEDEAPDEGNRARAVIGGGRTEMRRLERLRELFAEHGRLTRSEAAKVLSVSPTTATKDLKTLCAEGVIEKVMPSRSPRSHYFRLRSS